MTWEILPISQFHEHAQRWDELARGKNPIPFLESGFLQPLLDEFGSGQELLALESSQGQLRAAAILDKTRPGFWQTFQPSQLPLGAWVSRTGADLPQLGRSLVKALPGLAAGVGITQIDPILQPRPADSHGFNTLDYIDTAWVDIDASFDAYWETRGKNLKSNLRKQHNKLQKDGVTTLLECITQAEQVAQAIQDYGSLESAGWKAQDGTAIHAENAQGRFYQQMLENFCTLGRGRIYRYRFDDKVVAMDLCIESDDRLVILKTAYDESYKAVSPSSLMRQEQFEQLFNEGRLQRIEFYGRVMEWHTRWTDNARTLYHANSYRNQAVQSLINMRNRLRQSKTPADQTESGNTA